MRRDLDALAATPHDVLVVGGGIYGATITREAALRGLAVALVERDDFAAATSANSQKTIHGGLRYLQHLDLPRVRESIRERRTWLRIAPEWVRPLPVVIPTYGHGLRGGELLAAARAVHRLAGIGAGELPAAPPDVLPEGTLSPRDVVELFPGIEESGLTGGFVFHDAQVRDTERLAVAIVGSAVERGAIVANHVEAVDAIRESGGRIAGILARDRLGGAELAIRARVVVNACGPWTSSFLARVLGRPAERPPRLARGFNVITRKLFSQAVGLYGRASHDDPDAVLQRGGRLLFAVPWRDRTIFGTEFHAHPGAEPADEDPRVLRAAVERFLAEVSTACGGLHLGARDVSLVHVGWVPMASVSASGAVRLAKHFEIRDHGAEGAPGLLGVVGVKYTTVRDVAERVVDRVFAALGRTGPRSCSAEVPLPADPFGPEEPRDAAELAERARHVVRAEMALTLADVCRRLGLGAAEPPDATSLEVAAAAAGDELGWPAERRTAEIAAVEARPPLGREIRA